MLAGVLRSGGVVCYHGIVADLASSPVHVSAASFERQIDFLSDVFDIVPLAELVDRRERHKSIAGCLSLTFDDAYEGVLSIGEGILRTRALPATVFVASAPSARGATFWWDVVERLLAQQDTGALADLLKKNGAPSEIAERRELDPIRNWILDSRNGVIDLSSAGDSQIPDPRLRAMSETELGKLATDPRWTFASHTVSHPVLPLLPEAVQEHEVKSASAWLRERFQNVLPYVAYPYGFFSDATLRAARAGGMAAGFTMESRAPAPGDPSLALPRVGLSEDSRRRTATIRLSPMIRGLMQHRAEAPDSTRFRGLN